ncbi:MAG: AraC family transcriptional regulator [Hydrococcus sp. Prado102]|jgi:AraC family transcriptional regulator|nr:AraC family transcriptional regulator [Hydrococcus sp. Prado102]
MPSLMVDFAKEKERGYQRIFSRSPVLSSVSAQWNDLLIAYDNFVPGQTPDVCIKQHGIMIFIDLPTPVKAERAIDGKLRRERVLQGDLVIVPANAWHRAGWDIAGGAILLGLQTKEFLRTVDETIECDRIQLIPHFATPDPLVHQIGLALKQTLENPGKVGRLYAQTMTTTLMVHLLQHYCAQQLVLPTYSTGLSKLKLQRVIDYINAHLDRDLSLHELAAVVQISSHYFVQLFKRSTGITPHQYVIQCRIERAKQLLMKREATIADVARIVGFVDQSHFHRHFKRLVGITPKTFLQQINSSSLL